MTHEPDAEIAALRDAAEVGTAFAEAYERFRPRLERAVSLRMDERVRGRIDAGDVVQEAYIECAGRIEKYLEDPPAPLYLWVRFLVLQRLLQIHRKHIGRQARDARREVPIDRSFGPGASSRHIAAQLVDSHTSPTQAARRAEAQLQVQDALEEMSDVDREILVLRHFEQMSSADAAVVLGIEHDAARKRYLRALRRLRVVFEKFDP